MNGTWKKLSELKLGEVFNWAKFPGKWKVMDVHKKETRNQDGNSIVFWFVKTDSTDTMIFVKNVDKNDLVEIIEEC